MIKIVIGLIGTVLAADEVGPEGSILLGCFWLVLSIYFIRKGLLEIKYEDA